MVVFFLRSHEPPLFTIRSLVMISLICINSANRVEKGEKTKTTSCSRRQDVSQRRDALLGTDTTKGEKKCKKERDCFDGTTAKWSMEWTEVRPQSTGRGSINAALFPPRHLAHVLLSLWCDSYLLQTGRNRIKPHYIRYFSVHILCIIGIRG